MKKSQIKKIVKEEIDRFTGSDGQSFTTRAIVNGTLINAEITLWDARGNMPGLELELGTGIDAITVSLDSDVVQKIKQMIG